MQSLTESDFEEIEVAGNIKIHEGVREAIRDSFEYTSNIASNSFTYREVKTELKRLKRY